MFKCNKGLAPVGYRNYRYLCRKGSEDPHGHHSCQKVSPPLQLRRKLRVASSEANDAGIYLAGDALLLRLVVSSPSDQNSDRVTL